MFDPEVKKIVFLISSNMNQGQLEELKRAILNFLFQFHKNNPYSSKAYNKQFAENVRWSFQFLEKKPRNYSMLQEWKELKYAEVCLFEKALEKHCSDNQIDKSPVKNQASFLSDALKAIVHDYSWDNYGLISPVKKPTKRTSQSNRNCNLTSQVVDRFSSNIVVVVSQLPKSQNELDEFFDWQGTDKEYVCRKLMPPHLRVYFKQKYDISLLWIDTTAPSRPKILSDLGGMNTIRLFLNSLGGDILPVTVFAGSNLSNGFSVMREIGAFPFFHNARDGSNAKTNKKHLTIHVAKMLRHGDGSLNVEKIFSLVTKDASISPSLQQLFDHPCYFCSKQSGFKPELSHPICLSKDKSKVHVTVNGGLQKIDSTSESLTDCTILENVLVVMGRFLKEQVPLLLSHPEIMEICSVWCNVEWPSTQCNSSTWTGDFVAEVYRYCTACCNESSIEELGIKYAIIEMKTKSLATITYLRLKSSILLNPSCWLPGENSYSVSSPLKRLNKPRNESQELDKAPTSYTFCSSMLEDWYLMKPLPASIGIKYPKPKPRQQKSLAKQEWMAKLRQHYKTKLETNQQAVTSCKIRAESKFAESVTPLNNVRSLPELKDGFLKSINELTYSDLTTTQIKSLIRSVNSLFSAINRDHLKSVNPTMADYVKKLEEVECFQDLADIKQLTVKSEQTNSSVMQVMLLIKFVECHLDEKNLPKVIDAITSHVRLISLTAGYSAMINFLDKVLVEKFYDVCGKVLYEVYNELMLSIPVLLQAYAREEEDTTHSDSVLFSVNSFNSQASIFGSSKSCSLADATSRRQRFGTSSVSQLRRIIEIPSQAACDVIKPKENTAKTRVRKESSKSKGIIRDLFSAQDKPQTERAVFESPDTKKQRNVYVSDTPKVKQCMTAFTRQRLRMQKQYLCDENMQGITLIEESPAKGDEAPNDFKSSKLTRKHSFYCDGKDSRSVTRAQSLQQHQQGVLATPVVKETGARGGPSPKIGRRSLSSLFRSPNKESVNENQGINRAPSTSKILQKSPNDTFHSPLKMALRGYRAANTEQNAKSPHNTNLDTSPKVWRRSLSKLFHSPLSNSSKSNGEAMLVDGQAHEASKSSDIFENVHLQDVTMLSSEDSLHGEPNVGAQCQVPLPIENGNVNSPTDGNTNSCNKTVAHTQPQPGKTLTKRKRHKSSSS